MIALINNDETKLGQFEFIQIAILKRIKIDFTKDEKEMKENFYEIELEKKC